MLDVSDCDSHWRVAKIGPYLGEAGTTYIEQWRRQFKTFQGMPDKTKLAVSRLRMCSNGEKLGGVGQKVSEKTFWIEATPEILAEYKEEQNE